MICVGEREPISWVRGRSGEFQLVFCEQFFRRVVSAGLMTEQPQEVEGIEVLRIVGEDLPIKRLGLIKLPPLMQRHRLMERLHLIAHAVSPRRQ